jgi:maltose alpha-D-glucosyltransferase/alpha-amylase
VLLRVGYAEGEPETYVLPLTHVDARRPARSRSARRDALVARIRCNGRRACLVDALAERGFEEALLEAIERGGAFRSTLGELEGWRGPAFRRLRGGAPGPLEPAIMRAEQSNSVHRLRPAARPQVLPPRAGGNEPGPRDRPRADDARERRAHSARRRGAHDRARGRGPITLAILHGYVPNQGDAWSYTLGAVAQYFERMLARRNAITAPPPTPLLAFVDQEVPAADGGHDRRLSRVGPPPRPADRRAPPRARGVPEPDFTPEPFTTLYQRSIYQSMRARARQTLELLRKSRRAIPEPARADAERVVAADADVDRRPPRRDVAPPERRADPDPWRFPPGTGAPHREGLRHHRLRGRAGALAERAAPQARAASATSPACCARSTTPSTRRSRGERARGLEGARLEEAARAWYVWVASRFLRAYLEAAATWCRRPASSSSSSWTSHAR